MNGISFTPTALAWLQKQQPAPGTPLVVGLKKAGCAGQEHFLRWGTSEGVTMDSNAPFEVVAPHDSALLLQGLVVDLAPRGLNQELVWRNPNASDACGCGISWTFPERLLPTVS